MGTISNSTGSDGIQAIGELTVPAEATVGTTTMRVIKTFDASAEYPCAPGSGYGQTEDYTLDIQPSLGVDDHVGQQFSYYPNLVKGPLTITHPSMIKTVMVLNMLGRKVLSQSIGAVSVSLDLSGLPIGQYLVKATAGEGSETFKIAKVN